MDAQKRRDLPSRPPLARRSFAARDGFDFTGHMRALCADMVQRLPELAHIDLSRVAIGFAQARKSVGHGLQASLTPMRFEGGRRDTVRRGRRVGVQQILDAGGQEMLYLLTFYLPRFLNQPFDEKLVTILHELWHISPTFDGDLRRHAGRCYIHTTSEKQYDAAMARLAAKWLALDPPIERHGFLREDFASLTQRCGPIYGQKIPVPKLIPLDA